MVPGDVAPCHCINQKTSASFRERAYFPLVPMKMGYGGRLGHYTPRHRREGDNGQYQQAISQTTIKRGGSSQVPCGVNSFHLSVHKHTYMYICMYLILKHIHAHLVIYLYYIDARRSDTLFADTKTQYMRSRFTYPSSQETPTDSFTNLYELKIVIIYAIDNSVYLRKKALTDILSLHQRQTPSSVTRA